MERTNDTPAWTKAAEVELIYKSSVQPSERPLIVDSTDSNKLFRLHWDENKLGFIEQFKVALLNRANRVLGIYEVSTGGVSGTVADPKLIFVAALKASASGIIVCHNHPSGNLLPSRADEQLTKKIVEAGRFLDLPVLDHLIISTEGYFSFAEQGLL